MAKGAIVFVVFCLFTMFVMYHLAMPRVVWNDDRLTGRSPRLQAYSLTSAPIHINHNHPSSTSLPQHHTTHPLGWQYLPDFPLLSWHGSEAILTRDALLYLPHGSDCDIDTEQSVMRILDTVTWRWKSSLTHLRELPYLPLPRYRAATSHVGDWLFSIGGYYTSRSRDRDGESDAEHQRGDDTTIHRLPRREGYVLDLLATPKSGDRRWIQIPSMPEGRAEHTCVTLHLPSSPYSAELRSPSNNDGRTEANDANSPHDIPQVYCAGGYTDDLQIAGTTLVFDPLRMQWNYRAEMNVPRANVTFVAYGNTQIFAFGGSTLGSDGRFAESNVVEVYDTWADEWTELPRRLPDAVTIDSRVAVNTYDNWSGCQSIWLVGTKRTEKRSLQVVQYLPNNDTYLCYPELGNISATKQHQQHQSPLATNWYHDKEPSSAFFLDGALHIAVGLRSPRNDIGSTTDWNGDENRTSAGACKRDHLVYRPDPALAWPC
eukprot:TRINITY_DN1643_c0_g1_i1.p1 TRINITY_DN1643_c0_g1~~TRINITY_DN1643_c0_g1_i1.p1  ORF type:complete len:487 (+),score=47.76 TRINITY_DN1643_c0_g1_i1:123-1583(+)